MAGRDRVGINEGKPGADSAQGEKRVAASCIELAMLLQNRFRGLPRRVLICSIPRVRSHRL